DPPSEIRYHGAYGQAAADPDGHGGPALLRQLERSAGQPPRERPEAGRGPQPGPDGRPPHREITHGPGPRRRDVDRGEAGVEDGVVDGELGRGQTVNG